MHSMTGYGRGEACSEAHRFILELQSVNRKQSDIAISLPRPWAALEGRLREILQAKISRGRLNCSVSVQATAESGVDAALNEELAAHYAAAMKRLQQRLGLTGEVTLDAILRAPGVLQTPSSECSPEAAWPALEKALQQALSGLLQMRATEGAHLANDLQQRLTHLRSLLAHIRLRAPELPPQYRQHLLDRITSAGLQLPFDEERLVREVLLFADRSDITEELTRLDSHFQQFDSLLQSHAPVGRTLEFLTQEIVREYNTLGTKSADAPISQWVVESKVELEKIREQIQNIE
jgi:uncharacterized protein (TIGR00255 family)